MTDDVADDPEATGREATGPAATNEPAGRGGRKKRDDDPFANLVLDDSFVQGASVYEAPARTRAAVRRHPSAVPAAPSARARRRDRRAKASRPAVSPRDWSPADEPRSAKRGRLIVGLGTILVLVVGAGYLVFGNVFHHAAKPTAAPVTSASAAQVASPTANTTGQPQLDTRVYRRGHCYRWDATTDFAHVDDVTCDGPHLFEAVADQAITIVAEFPLGASYPPEDQWDEIDKRYCQQPVEKFLGYPVDPYGRFSVGAIRPTQDGWQTADRDVHCGLYGHTPGTPPSTGQDDLFSGKVEGADQSWVYPVGTCLFSSPGSDQDDTVVPCTEPHQYVAVGNPRLSDTPDGTPPSAASFNQQAEQRCRAVARGALGASFQETSTVRLGWYVIRPESWRAGTRAFTCTVNYTTAANQPRPVTGDQLHPTQGVLA